MKMNELNTEIQAKETALLNRRLFENDEKRGLENKKLEANNNLDSSLPAFSNMAKRDKFVESMPGIIDIKSAIKDHKYKTDLLEIEIGYLLRKFEIMIGGRE